MSKPKVRRKYLQNIYSKKGFYLGYMFKLLQLNNERTNNTIKIGQRFEHLTEDIQMANKHITKYSTVLVIMEMQIKTTNEIPLHAT